MKYGNAGHLTGLKTDATCQPDTPATTPPLSNGPKKIAYIPEDTESHPLNLTLKYPHPQLL